MKNKKKNSKRTHVQFAKNLINAKRRFVNYHVGIIIMTAVLKNGLRCITVVLFVEKLYD